MAFRTIVIKNRCKLEYSLNYLVCRGEEEKKILWEAKAVLMERNHMTEEEAHRYIQKCSMDSGTSLTETAQMVLSMIKL